MSLLATAKFYQTLLKLKIKKSSSEYANLSRFLRMSEQTPDLILVKKLTKVVEEFLRNHYLKSFGYRKSKLEDFMSG